MAAKVLAFKAVVGVLVPILIALAFMGWVKHTFRAETFTRPKSTSTQVQQHPIAPSPQPTLARPLAVDQVEVAPPAYKPHEPTPEEIREQQRKAEEAIKILEATTPELYQGRPGQVRGQ